MSRADSGEAKEARRGSSDALFRIPVRAVHKVARGLMSVERNSEPGAPGSERTVLRKVETHPDPELAGAGSQTSLLLGALTQMHTLSQDISPV